MSSNCHAQIGRGFMSKDKVARAKDAPYCLQRGYADGLFDFSSESPDILFAAHRMHKTAVPLIVAGEPVLSIEAPETRGAPILLSGEFWNSQGDPSLKIVANQ